MWRICRLLGAVIAAIQVGAQDVVQGKPCVQSSTRHSHEFCEHGNDGDDSTYCVTAAQDNPYWMADLGGHYIITHMEAIMYNADFASGTSFYIAFYNPVTRSDDCVQYCGSNTMGSVTTLTTCPTDFPARYILANRTGNVMLSLRSLRAYGSLSTIISNCDVDECALSTDNCSVNATCSNNNGGFDCTCNQGYNGDGVTCTDADECTQGTHNCHSDATCTNNVGSFECNCDIGFTGTGLECGPNIMFEKSSKQSSTYDSNLNHYANDGNKRSPFPSMTMWEENPYWQGDLQGFYVIKRIAVISDRLQASDLKRAIIEVSVHDVTCPEGRVTRCGQWPDQTLYETTRTFFCPDAGPVRFVRVRREGRENLALEEVEVEGEPARITGTKYDTFFSKIVTSAISSLTVADVMGCGKVCHHTQPCIAFSYSEFVQPNCLLATNVTMTSDVNWVSYSVRLCFGNVNCDPTEPFI